MNPTADDQKTTAAGLMCSCLCSKCRAMMLRGLATCRMKMTEKVEMGKYKCMIASSLCRMENVLVLRMSPISRRETETKG